MSYYWMINPSLRCSIKLVLIVLLQTNFMVCWSLNYEGVALLKCRERVVKDPFGALSSWNEDVGETDHCSWFGIECADGHVVSLDLKKLGLEGTLAPELGNLLHMKTILLDNNGLSHDISSEPKELMTVSEVELEEKHLTSAVELLPHTRHNGQPTDAVHLHPRMRSRKLLANPIPDKSSSSNSPPKPRNLFPSFHLPHLGRISPPRDQVSAQNTPPLVHRASPPTEIPSSSSTHSSLSLPPPHAPHPLPSSNGKTNMILIVAAAVGGFAGLVLVVGIFLWRSNKIANVAPWATGLSGQLQKAFVTGTARSDGFYSGKRSFIEGIPNLKRSELETACEDFSNVIGSSSLGTIYKGTLSNGIEIAVISLPVTSVKDWSRTLESEFRKKIETLSKVNHKNFVNLIGYCEEKRPFARMLVFEYAPNGSLFEHLHIREAEHLDWGMRLRVAMGMAYCLEHMHQLTPPRIHPNLNSSSVNLSEDYAAKISDFYFWNEIAPKQMHPNGILASLSASSASPESNVFNFGLVLLEIMTGQIPLSSENNYSIENWVSGYLRGEQMLQELVDPMLRHFNPEQLERISKAIRNCLHSDPKERPTMNDITARLREITGIDRDKATPRLSPLWWAELEVRSVNGE